MIYLRKIALLLAVLLAVGGVASAQSWMELPESLERIEEEAFYDTSAAEAVYVPRGTKQIQTRAFARSGLTEISLPDSLTFIAEDAFEGSSLRTVYALRGTYAYKWAVDHGYIVVEKAVFGVRLECSAASACEGDTVTWTARAMSGGALSYSFQIYRDGTLVHSVADAASNAVSLTVGTRGVYTAFVQARDSVGNQAEGSAEALTVTAAPLVITGVTCESESLYTTQTHSWTVSLAGGIAPYQYAFTLMKNNAVLDTRGYAASNAFAFTFFEHGSYTLRVSARDAEGQVAADYSLPFSVTLWDTLVTGRVRIYVDVDSRGRIVRDNTKTGHFELEIDNNGHTVDFDGHSFVDPVFSFGRSGTQGTVTVFDGSQVNHSNSLLYSFEFTTSGSSVQDLLMNTLRRDWLDTDSETPNSIGTVYNVTKGDFTTYRIETHNCFTALAAWCSVLGYNQLTNIVASSASYTDYIAWRMYDQYGKNWTYIKKT